MGVVVVWYCVSEKNFRCKFFERMCQCKNFKHCLRFDEVNVVSLVSRFLGHCKNSQLVYNISFDKSIVFLKKF